MAPNTHILEYVNELDNIYIKQMEKIGFMRSRLSNFKILLAEEDVLSKKIHKINNDLNSAYELQSNVSNYENANNYENEIEIN